MHGAAITALENAAAGLRTRLVHVTRDVDSAKADRDSLDLKLGDALTRRAEVLYSTGEIEAAIALLKNPGQGGPPA